EAGAARAGGGAFEAGRIEHGLPLFGRGNSDKNLPQGEARDALAISFFKSCYLGEGNGARGDAPGHINKLLVCVWFRGSQVPPAGTELRAGGDVVGQVTSAAWSPRLSAPLALAYVRRAASALASRLESALGEAEVISLPVG